MDRASTTSILRLDAPQRVFIVSAGRTGSTLLAAILADAGAEFGMAVPARWDRGAGELEHPDFRRATEWLRAAHDLAPAERPRGPRRYAWNLMRSLGKRRLRAALKRASVLKGRDCDLAVKPALKLGYFPRIILSYRRFEDHSVSLALRSGHSDFATLARYYTRVNRNGLLLLNLFGGCVVSFDQLTGHDDRSWIGTIARLTGLAPARLLQAWQRRLEQQTPPVPVAYLHRGTQEIFAAVDRLRGELVPPSPQALRSWNQVQPAQIAVPTAQLWADDMRLRRRS